MTGSWTIDSIEDGVAALHDGERLVRLPAELLPEGAREGDVVRVERRARGEAVSWRLALDRAAAERALAESRAQVEGLRATDGGGDITL